MCKPEFHLLMNLETAATSVVWVEFNIAQSCQYSCTWESNTNTLSLAFSVCLPLHPSALLCVAALVLGGNCPSVQLLLCS